MFCTDKTCLNCDPPEKKKDWYLPLVILCSVLLYLQYTCQQSIVVPELKGYFYTPMIPHTTQKATLRYSISANPQQLFTISAKELNRSLVKNASLQSIINKWGSPYHLSSSGSFICLHYRCKDYVLRVTFNRERLAHTDS